MQAVQIKLILIITTGSLARIIAHWCISVLAWYYKRVLIIFSKFVINAKLCPR